MKPTIKPVSCKADLKEFVRFPRRLYQGNKYYVPQIDSMEMDTLSPKTNHAFEHCESEMWLAIGPDGKTVGRIAGIINREYNRKTNTKYARFGWMDFIDDKEVSTALLDTVREWGRERGMELMTGPLGFLEFDASGVLVEGFEEIPTAYGKYNYPYYEQHMLDYGFGKDIDWVEFRVNIPSVIPENFTKAANIVSERYNLHELKLKRKSDLKPYFTEIFNLMNKAYNRLHGYSLLSAGQIEDLKKQFLPNVNLKFVSIILDSDNNVVAFGVALPSLSKALQKANGSLFPFGFIHLLKALNDNDTLDALLIAVEDDYRKKGVHAMIFNSMFHNAKEFGIKYIESTRELEDNFNVQNLWNKFDPRLHKRARCYIKEI